jgi:hypothetical protein
MAKKNIDTQKTKSTTSSKKKNVVDWLGFGMNLSSSMFWLMNGIFMVSTITLYTTLLAETKMLSLDKAPKNISSEVITHTVRVYSGLIPKLKSVYETKLMFNSNEVHEKLTNNTLMKLMNESTFPLVNFLKEVLTGMINTNFKIINSIYSVAYKLPESVVMCLFLYLSPIIWILMFFLNILTAIIYHMVNFKDYFTEYNESTKKFDSGAYTISNFVITFMYVFFLFLPFVFFGLPLVSMLFTICAPLLIGCVNSNNDKKYNFIQFVYDMLSYKRQVIMLLVSYTLLKVVFSNLGTYNGIACFVALLFLFIFSKVFNQYIPDSPKTK